MNFESVPHTHIGRPAYIEDRIASGGLAPITLSPGVVEGLRRVAATMQEAADRRARAVEKVPMDLDLVERLEHETLTAAYGLLGYVQGAIGK